MFANGVVPYLKSSQINWSAISGYQALAQHDSNYDGQINSQDAVYSQLRVWRDLNQDGISQAGELQTLQSLGIAGVGLDGNSKRYVFNSCLRCIPLGLRPNTNENRGSKKFGEIIK